MYRTDFGTLWEKARVGCSERTALKQVYYQGWNRSPAQVGCVRQVLRAGALGRPRGMGWGGRREGGSGWGTQVNPWLIHVNVWQKPPQYCKVISLQLIKINEKKKKEKKKELLFLFAIVPGTLEYSHDGSQRQSIKGCILLVALIEARPPDCAQIVLSSFQDIPWPGARWRENVEMTPAGLSNHSQSPSVC